MEQLREQERREQPAEQRAPETGPAGWARYDAVPRDGPAVFVTDAERWDAGEVDGVWVGPHVPVETVAQAVEACTGQPVPAERLVVVDQVGVEGRMLDEDWFAEPGADW